MDSPEVLVADLGKRKHGTESAYTAGCRCDRCRRAARVARAERKARAAEKTSDRSSDREETGRRADVTQIGSAKAKGRRTRRTSSAPLAAVPPAGPATVEEAVNEFVKDLGTDPGLMFDIVLARRLAHEIDSPSTSMSVAPIVTQLRDLMEKLEKKRTGGAVSNAFGGLSFGAR